MSTRAHIPRRRVILKNIPIINYTPRIRFASEPAGCANLY